MLGVPADCAGANGDGRARPPAEERARRPGLSARRGDRRSSLRSTSTRSPVVSRPRRNNAGSPALRGTETALTDRLDFDSPHAGGWVDRCWCAGADQRERQRRPARWRLGAATEQAQGAPLTPRANQVRDPTPDAWSSTRRVRRLATQTEGEHQKEGPLGVGGKGGAEETVHSVRRPSVGWTCVVLWEGRT